MRTTEEQRKQTEARIRAATDRILRGDTPSGRHCDVKTLAVEAGVSRAALYSTYRHLKEDFERRRDNLRSTGDVPDPRDRQITNLKQRLTTLRERVAKQQQELDELEDFRVLAVSRIAAQHDEITRLRGLVGMRNNVHNIRSSDHRKT